MPESLRNTLSFLRDLAANNNKQWFDQNRKRYDAAREHFEAFISELIVAAGEVEDLAGVTPKDCMLRINRDIRFSPDKTPYKTAMSAVIGKGGRKATGRSYYVHIEPDNHSIVAGGLHSPSSQELEKVRRSIAEDSKEFKKIISKSDFTRYFGSLQGESLKTAPQGYPKDHPDIDLLRMKQYLAFHDLSDENVLSSDLIPNLVAMIKALKPFEAYLQSALSSVS
jgi:uncharacterized protein (TIGR02453 family)